MAAPARMMFINFFISLLDLKCWELFEDGILDFVSFEPCRALANYILNRNIEDVHFRGIVGLISFHSVDYYFLSCQILRPCTIPAQGRGELAC